MNKANNLLGVFNQGRAGPAVLECLSAGDMRAILVTSPDVRGAVKNLFKGRLMKPILAREAKAEAPRLKARADSINQALTARKERIKAFADMQIMLYFMCAVLIAWCMAQI